MKKKGLTSLNQHNLEKKTKTGKVMSGFILSFVMVTKNVGIMNG